MDELIQEYRRSGNWDFVLQNPGGWFALRWDGPGMPPEHEPVAPFVLFDAEKRPLTVRDFSSQNSYRLIRVKADSQLVGWLGVREHESPIHHLDAEFISHQSQTYYAIGTVAIILAVLLTSLLSRHILAPIKKVEILKDYLVSAGYRVSCLDRGDLVLPHLKQSPPSLILLDIMIPGMNGFDVCRGIRQFSNVPIIMITARVEEIDRLLGLEFGADDYICKPFSPREVVARVNAVMRRIYTPNVQKSLTAAELVLIEETRQALAGGKELNLTPCEYNLLKALLSHPNRIFSRNELINVVQGYDFEGYDRTIDSHVKNLRKKIAQHLPGKEIINIIYGVGYKLNSHPD